MLVDSTGKRVKISANQIVDYNQTATIYDGVFSHDGTDVIYDGKMYEVDPDPIKITEYKNEIIMIYPTKIIIFDDGINTYDAEINKGFILFYYSEGLIIFGNPNFYRVTCRVEKIGKLPKNCRLFSCGPRKYIYQKNSEFYSRSYSKISLPKKVKAEFGELGGHETVTIKDVLYVMNCDTIFSFLVGIRDLICDDEYALYNCDFLQFCMSTGMLSVESKRCLLSADNSYVDHVGDLDIV